MFDADDAAIQRLKERAGPALSDAIALIELYINTSPTTPDGQTTRLAIIQGQPITINGQRMALTITKQRQLVEFLKQQSVHDRVALQTVISHLELASAVGQDDVLRILQDIDFIYIPPGIVQKEQREYVAHAKAYSYAYKMAVGRGDTTEANRLFAIGRAYIIAHFPNDTSSIIANIPDEYPGFLGAYKEGFNLAQGAGRKGRPKREGLVWMDEYHWLSTHPNRPHVNKVLSTYWDKNAGPLAVVAERNKATQSPSQKPLVGPAVQQLQDNAQSAKDRISLLNKEIPGGQRVAITGREGEQAARMAKIAQTLGMRNVTPPTRLRREELTLYTNSLQDDIDEFVKQRTGTIGVEADRTAAIGGAVKHYVTDTDTLLPYLKHTVEAEFIDRSKKVPLADKLREIDKPLRMQP